MGNLRLPLLAGLCLLAASVSAQTPSTIRALFIGNSLTDVNDVPGIVQALAQVQGVTLLVEVRAPGGVNLEDHWGFGHPQLLRQSDFDIVILQQGPSTLPDSQTNLREWAVNWANFARQEGTIPALYMVWPFAGQDAGFDLVSMSYRNAATAAGALIFPAGEAWAAALNRQPGLQLYLDDLHGNQAGSLLAAMVIGRGMFSLDPARVPARVSTRAGTITISESTLALFRSVVAEMPAHTINPQTDITTPPPAAPGSTAPPPPPTPGAAPGAGGGGGATSPVMFVLVAALLAWSAYERRTGS